MKTVKLNLSTKEKQALKQNGVKVNDLQRFATDELAVLLDTNLHRAREISASVTFQQIPSIGPRFAGDLILLGYYSLDDLVEKDGAELFNELAEKQGFRTDPCVEDQFRLAVHYAQHRDTNKRWWHFTVERKVYHDKCALTSDRLVEN